jgi:hypothetical protein
MLEVGLDSIMNASQVRMGLSRESDTVGHILDYDHEEVHSCFPLLRSSS